ncbi:MAG: hypothetical protein VCA40_15540, partial [Roseibacillus sp.]
MLCENSVNGLSLIRAQFSSQNGKRTEEWRLQGAAGRQAAPRWLLVDGKLAPLAADPRGASTVVEGVQG